MRSMLRRGVVILACGTASTALAQSIEVRLLEGDAVAGIPGVVQFLHQLSLNAGGQFAHSADTDAASTDDEFIAIGTVLPFTVGLLAGESDSVSGEPAFTYGRVDRSLDINGSGVSVFVSATLPGPSDTLYMDGVKFLRAGESMIGGETINSLHMPRIDATGTAWYIADIGSDSATDKALMSGSTMLFREGGSIGGVPIDTISTSDTSTSGAKLDVNDAGDYIIEIDMAAGSGSPDKVVIVNGVEVLREGGVVADLGTLDFVNVCGVTESGDWFVKAEALPAIIGPEAILLNGVIIARSGDPLGGGLLIDDFQIVDVNSSGDWVADVDLLGAPTTDSDAALVANGEIIAREGDPVPGLAGHVWGTAFGFVGDLELNDAGQFIAAGVVRRVSDDELLDALIVGSIGGGCACDVSGDGAVDVSDLLDFLVPWFGESGGPPPGGAGSGADFNADNTVDVSDLLEFLACWFSASSGGPCP